MKARWWLLLAAALVLLPSAAHAQKKKPKGTAATPAAAPAAAPAAPAAGGEIELDAPATPPPDANGAQPAAPGAAAAPDATGGAAPSAGAEATTGAGGAPAGGICEIDPSACPKPEDIARAAKRPVKAEVYAVEQIYALRRFRLELNPYWGFTLNDQFVSHDGPGADIKFYVTNVLAIGVNGNLYQGLNGDSDFNFENRRAAHISVPLNEYQWGANLNFTYVPVYGKFAGFNEFIFSYDLYVVGGLGAISTRPISVIDPDNRTFQFQPKLDVDLGIGLRIFLNRWFGVTLEIRDYIYSEQLENTCIAGQSVPNPAPEGCVTTHFKDPGASASTSSTWLGESTLTNNVQAQIGITIFLPFSWEYRLPK
jgi:outer membrane beta-barrel protein